MLAHPKQVMPYITYKQDKEQIRKGRFFLIA